MPKEPKLTAVPKPTNEPVALPAQLEPADLAYQTALIQRIQQEQNQHQALLRVWSEYLAKKLGLGPKDVIHADGRITRVEADG